MISSASNAGLLVAFLKPHIQPMHGSSIEVAVLYENYADWWADHGGVSRPLSAKQFWGALRAVCKHAGIRVEKLEGRVCCLGVRLIDSGVKALPAPAPAASPQT